MKFQIPLISTLLLFRSSEAGECHSLGPKKARAGRLNIILVPSAYDTLDATTFGKDSERIFSEFEKHPLLDPAVMDTVAVHYAIPNKNPGNYCHFNCGGLDRLLCCDDATAKSIVAESCGTGFNTQIVVVHNDPKYGGSGGEVAAVSTHASSPKIAIHEIGHSSFNLADEYDSPNTPPDAPNCDSDATCPKWASLLSPSLFDTGCIAGYCKGGAYSIGKVSIMKDLALDFEAVNEQHMCCVLENIGRKKEKYCARYPAKKCVSTNFNVLQGKRTAVHTKSGGVLTMEHVESPVLVTFNLVKSDGTWQVSKTENLRAGVYKTKDLYGDYVSHKQALHTTAPMEVRLVPETALRGEQPTPGHLVALVHSHKAYEIPGEVEMAGYVTIKKESFQVVVDANELVGHSLVVADQR